MDIVRCMNGHFYDQDTYSVCPHCGGEKDKMVNSSNSKNKEKNSKFSLTKLFGGKRDDVETQSMFMSPKSANQSDANLPVSSDINQLNDSKVDERSEDEHTYNFWDSNTFSQSIDSEEKLDEYLNSITDVKSTDSKDTSSEMIDSEPQSTVEQNAPEVSTDVPDNTSNLQQNESNTSVEEVKSSQIESNDPVEDTKTTSSIESNTSVEETTTPSNGSNISVEEVKTPQNEPNALTDEAKVPSNETDVQKETNMSSSLQDQLQQATGNDGKTFGYFSINNAGDKKASSGDGEKQESSANVLTGEPVVGWLVCIKGPAFGQSFNVYCGRNSIGRSSTNRIVVPNDNHISREKHAHVLYEPKKREFWIQPGDSNSLVYFNGDVVMTPAKLDYYSEIEIGETKLILIPLCCETFSWEDFEE